MTYLIKHEGWGFLGSEANDSSPGVWTKYQDKAKRFRNWGDCERAILPWATNVRRKMKFVEEKDGR